MVVTAQFFPERSEVLYVTPERFCNYLSHEFPDLVLVDPALTSLFTSVITRTVNNDGVTETYDYPVYSLFYEVFGIWFEILLNPTDQYCRVTQSNLDFSKHLIFDECISSFYPEDAAKYHFYEEVEHDGPEEHEEKK